MNNISPGFLVLDTGEAYQGSFPQACFLGDSSIEPRVGEIVFNTSHSGYEEIATDPSYMGQIVVMTAPMMGNYGAEDKVWESDRIWIEGFICLQLQSSDRDKAWLDRLSKNGTPILTEVDTRSLVLRLRQGGTPRGVILAAKNSEEAKAKATQILQENHIQEKDWVSIASRKKYEKRMGQNASAPRIAVMDFGCKENILRELQKRFSELHIFHSRTSTEEILKVSPHAIMLTNGPGDPAEVKQAPQTVQSLIGKLPIFGICMGHQVLGLALGAKTYKLKFGHRGSNHPIKDQLLNKVYMTSQNHGYAVDAKTLPADAQVTQVNLNDMTCAGFYSKTKKYLGIQYHPESHPGPHEAAGLFDFFVDMVKREF